MGGALPERLRTAFERGGEMGRRMLALDWADTPLGVPAQWPAELASAVATMLASKAQIVLFWGDDYCALYNDAYITAMGSKHPGHLGRPGREMWAETWSLLQDLFDGVTATDEAYYAADHPFMLERYGFLEETYFDISYDPIRRDDGTVGGVFCIVSDTTRRVLADRRVRTLSRLGSLLADSPDQGALGAQAARVLGDNPGDVPFALLYLDGPADGDGPAPAGSCGVPAASGPLRAEARQMVQEVMRTNRPASVPVADVTDAAPPSAADQALVLPVGTGGSDAGALVVGVSRYLAMDDGYRDFLDLATTQISRAVTNLRSFEQERQRAAELAALDAAKTNFFSNVSHEFRTPLTLILGPLEDLLTSRGIGDDELRERLLPMQRNGLRLLRLVNTVLDFSRLESGRLRAEYRPTDLADYTARLASTFRSAAERAGLDLQVNCPPLSGPVHVDREMWEKIVFNLLSNAVKFTRSGGITVRLGERLGCAVLEVADTGVGVNAADQQLLFDRFHRVTGSWSRSHEGTGIGLALVRELAEMHGGTASARSEPGVGSTFTVTIPLGTAHLAADRILDVGTAAVPDEQARLYVEEAHWWLGDTGSEPGARSAPGEVEDARRGRVLLVDDNADLRDHVARLLRPHWEVTTAVDGLEALERAGRDPFDLILTDVMMPRLDGFGLIKALRADERTRDVPIVVLSARAGEESSVEGLSVGADDYLVKPFSARDLTARVRANLELGQLRRQIISRLRGLVDAAAAVNTVRTTAEVLEVAARHVAAMTSARRVVLTATGNRAEVVGDLTGPPEPDAVLPLPDTAGATLGELKVWSGADGAPEPVLLTQLARLVGLRLENARLYEAEHRIASTLQHSLLPQSLPRVPGAIVASRYLPGSSEAEVGGDWYDVIVAPGDRLFLVIGDVVGKGVQAAAGMGQLRNALRAYILEGFDCGEALTRLNRLVDNLGRRQFATVVCVRFDPHTRELHYSAAGHPSPVRAAPGEEGEFLYTAALGPPIGALAGSAYPTLRTELSAGDRLLLYTDGLVEDRRQGIDTGLAEVCAELAKPADHVEDLLDNLLAKAARHTRRDDIALLALQATEPREFELRLPADPTRLSVLRRRLEDFLTGNEVPQSDIFDLMVAVSEAAANAIEHPVDPAEPVIAIRVSLDEDAVTATVHDTGRWRPATGPSFRGRGLALIGALAELSVIRSEAGTTVTLRRPLSRA
ncbi:SpoIIE family protein phosphatase [Couchioplanes caeruleus]|uniref:Protein-serine/threonine phosphatase n=2 Tax=Couchioplanes caeruleus TaxID=56438 RepID=A0A1K0FCC7_9ACTN|nr:SpoIIE family protein phosphatase [Couchioplanes caeruleus]OJF10485.1 histidine kinase [Couchioplanes caeruleus subsp. caeruleus]ROP32568.1 histidine kinase-like protein [Couchioplanes caeruleus]